MLMRPLLLALALAAPAFAQETASRVTLQAETIRTYAVPEANQGVAVDETFFYAIDNQTIAKYEKATGTRVATWKGDKSGPIKHLDSGVVVEGKLYTAHSNYPDWPMVSSVEIWDTATLKHVGTHSFGIDRGSLTWLDYHGGTWWGTFANYNKVFGRAQMAYGNKYTTQLVRFGADWQIAESWVLPDALLDKFEDMTNSGGSWGPDGKLYLSGHDPAEIYRVEFPEFGSVMRWVATFPAEIAGQGIAWDRSTPDVIYGIVRKDRKVTATKVTLQ